MLLPFVLWLQARLYKWRLAARTNLGKAGYRRTVNEGRAIR